MFHSDNYVDHLCAKVQANRFSSVVTWLTHDHTTTHTIYDDMMTEFAVTREETNTVLTSPFFTLLVM